MTDRISLHDVYAEDRKDLPCTPFTFSGGEPHVQLDPKAIEGRYLWVDARLCSADGFMRTLAVLDAVRGCNPKRLGLFLPYFPGARQDRRQAGAPFTLRLYAQAIEQLGLDAIVTLDPHSSALSSMLDPDIIPAHHLIPMDAYDGFICPDEGAEARTLAAAKALGQTRIVHARKKRDSATGKLSGFVCDPLPTSGRYLVVDDICDGGGTFLGLADATGPGSHTLDLWVSHGIFSRGLDALLTKFDRIITTDSFPFTVGSPRLIVRECHSHAAAIMRRRIGT